MSSRFRWSLIMISRRKYIAQSLCIQVLILFPLAIEKIIFTELDDLAVSEEKEWQLMSVLSFSSIL